MTVRSARVWHAMTAAAAVAALVLQLVLVLDGGRVLGEADPPGLATRLGRLASYFTIQSNLLVAVVTAQLVRDPRRDGPWWRVARLAAVAGITVTGVVHFLLLRPLLDLGGADLVADTLLHVVVPLLAVTGWVAWGPRPRVSLRTVGLTLCWPVAWVVETLVVGAVTGWYPYPFLDPDEDGVLAVVLSIAAITVFFLLVFAVLRLVDQRAAPRPSGRR